MLCIDVGSVPSAGILRSRYLKVNVWVLNRSPNFGNSNLPVTPSSVESVDSEGQRLADSVKFEIFSSDIASVGSPKTDTHRQAATPVTLATVQPQRFPSSISKIATWETAGFRFRAALHPLSARSVDRLVAHFYGLVDPTKRPFKYQFTQEFRLRRECS